VKVRFLADADLNQAIVSGLLRREPSLDFLTARMAALNGLRDAEVLALAAKQQRVLVSHDASTMPAQFQVFRNDGRASAGVLLIPQKMEVGKAIDELMLVWMASEMAEWENRLVWLPL
jgi:hypothetical protein